MARDNANARSGETVGTLSETHHFAEKDRVTAMRIAQVCDSKDARDAARGGQEQGMEAGYEQLDAMLAQPA